MATADLPLGLRLSRQAGWNQIEADWRRFQYLGADGCFVAELDGTAVGTTTTCIFASIAWIAMVLVDAEVRRQGVGSALLKHALAFLDTQGVKTVRLDATAAGQCVYEKLDFVPEYPLTRYEGIASKTETECNTVQATAAMFPELIALDRRMTGTDRTKLLVRLFEDSPEAVRVLHRGCTLEGFVTMRRGKNAIQIGPCVATPQTGPMLLDEALDRCAGKRVLMDVPCGNARAVETVEANGLKARRHFMRMHRGEPIVDRVEALWASSGPEKG